MLLCAGATRTLGAQGGAVNLQNGLRLSAAGAYDSAALVFEAIVAAKRPATPRALQELVGLYARADRKDDAYRAFESARASGTDLSGIAARNDIGSLKSDRRFAILFPRPSDFARPFVEPVRIIHEWRGDSVGDEFGWIARGIGDVDGDRVIDVVVSATMNPPFGATHGKVYAYSGRSGKLLWSHAGELGWVLGTSVESAGDVDRDGVPDVIAGAPGALRAIVWSGRTGRELHRFSGDSSEANFGGAVSGVGDIDSDGFDDVIVGASGTSALQRGAGRAIVFSGKTGARLLTLDGAGANDAFGSAVTGSNGQLIAIGAPGAGATHRGRVYLYDGRSTSARFTKDADDTGGALGAMFVSTPGDVNGDGVADVFASDFANSSGGAGSGRAYVYSGATGETLLTLSGARVGEALGTSASRAGDVDGDGRADLVIGAWQHGSAAWSGGRVTVYSGATGRVLQQFTGRIPGETLGFDAVGIGDVDGDGAVDFLVTSAYSAVHGSRSGRVYVVAGKRIGKPHSTRKQRR